jgi:hypothetical protein
MWPGEIGDHQRHSLVAGEEFCDGLRILLRALLALGRVEQKYFIAEPGYDLVISWIRQ